MEKSSSQHRREVYLKALGLVSEQEFAEWRRTGRYPVIVKLGYPSPLVISPALARDARLSHLAVRLYLLLADLAINSSVQMYQDDIARLLNRSRATIRRVQNKELKATGWIDVRWIGFGFPNVIILNDKPRSLP